MRRDCGRVPRTARRAWAVVHAAALVAWALARAAARGAGAIASAAEPYASALFHGAVHWAAAALRAAVEAQHGGAAVARARAAAVDTDLFVPFAEKEDAKRGGARWGRPRGRWYAPALLDEERHDRLVSRWGMTLEEREAATRRLAALGQRRAAAAAATSAAAAAAESYPSHVTVAHARSARPLPPAVPPPLPRAALADVAIPVYLGARGSRGVGGRGGAATAVGSGGVGFCPAFFAADYALRDRAIAAGAQWREDRRAWYAERPETYLAMRAAGFEVTS